MFLRVHAIHPDADFFNEDLHEEHFLLVDEIVWRVEVLQILGVSARQMMVVRVGRHEGIDRGLCAHVL